MYIWFTPDDNEAVLGRATFAVDAITEADCILRAACIPVADEPINVAFNNPGVFEFMNLNKGALSQVALGRNSHHKGWRIVCDDLNEVPKIDRKKAKKHLWYNKNLGITLELSVRELAEKFSGEKLYLSHLYRVASGKKASYKGWSVV